MEAPQVAAAGQNSSIAKSTKPVATDKTDNVATPEKEISVSTNTKSDNADIDVQPQTTTVKSGNPISPTQKTTSRIVLKDSKGALGYSWNNLRQMSKPKKMQIIPGTLGTDDPNSANKNEYQEFTQQELEFQWMSMCNRMPQKLSGIAARMKNMNPVITEFPNIEVTVENQIMLDQIQAIRGSVVNTLKLYLHNSEITFNMKMAERNEQVKVLTRREQFEMMSRQNPAIEKLRALLDLELA